MSSSRRRCSGTSPTERVPGNERVPRGRPLIGWGLTAALVGFVAAGSARGADINFAQLVDRQQTMARNGVDFRTFLETVLTDDAKEIARGDDNGDKDAAFLQYLRERYGIGKPADLRAASENLRVAADRGCPAAFFWMADACHTGFGVDVNDVKAVEWAKKASAAGNSDGDLMVAAFAETGLIDKADPAGALATYKSAASTGNLRALASVGVCEIDGTGTAKDVAAGLRDLEKASDGGCVFATNMLADAYQSSRVGPPDFDKANRWRQKAVDAGSVRALIDQAVDYAQGRGVNKDQDKAMSLIDEAARTGDDEAMLTAARTAELFKRAQPEGVTAMFKRAADHGSVSANKLLGDRYLTGTGAEKNVETAITYYKLASRYGDGSASFELGVMYSGGKFGPANPLAAFLEFRRGGTLGNMPATAAMAQCYLDGRGVEKDTNAAVKLFYSAAEHQYGPAEYTLADLLMSGKVIKPDPKLAATYYARSAQHGVRGGGIKLTAMLLTGTGVDRDEQKAIDVLAEVLHMNRGRAAAEIGGWYFEGSFVPKDPAEGFKWTRRAVDANDPVGMNNLATCYEEGMGTAQDLQQAVNWYKKAADAGLGNAMDSLGSMYADGRGVGKDPTAALDFYRKADAHDSASGSGHLAVWLAKGTACPADPDGAEKAALHAAALGDPAPLKSLGDEFLNGTDGVTKDPARGERLLAGYTRRVPATSPSTTAPAK